MEQLFEFSLKTLPLVTVKVDTWNSNYQTVADKNFWLDQMVKIDGIYASIIIR